MTPPKQYYKHEVSNAFGIWVCKRCTGESRSLEKLQSVPCNAAFVHKFMEIDAHHIFWGCGFLYLPSGFPLFAQPVNTIFIQTHPNLICKEKLKAVQQKMQVILALQAQKAEIEEEREKRLQASVDAVMAGKIPCHLPWLGMVLTFLDSGVKGNG